MLDKKNKNMKMTIQQNEKKKSLVIYTSNGLFP